MDSAQFFSAIMAVLMFSAFVKFAVTLSVLKMGLGLEGLAFSVIVLCIAFVLAVLVSPQVIAVKPESLLAAMPPTSADNPKTDPAQLECLKFLEQHGDKSLRDRFAQITHKEPSTPNIVTAAFLMTELREAFEIGLVLLIPFVVIDLLVANLLMLLGVTQLPVGLITLALKLMLFVAVDGWTLLSERLIKEYFSA